MDQRFTTSNGDARQRAQRAAQQMGYELHVASAELIATGGQLAVALTVTNTGAAPFYYDWPVELGALDANGELTATWKTEWKLSGILPGEPAVHWRSPLNLIETAAGAVHLVLRVPNPLPKAPPIRFANQTQDLHLLGWLTLGAVSK